MSERNGNCRCILWYVFIYISNSLSSSSASSTSSVPTYDPIDCLLFLLLKSEQHNGYMRRTQWMMLMIILVRPDADVSPKPKCHPSRQTQSNSLPIFDEVDEMKIGGRCTNKHRGGRLTLLFISLYLAAVNADAESTI